MRNGKIQLVDKDSLNVCLLTPADAELLRDLGLADGVYKRGKLRHMLMTAEKSQVLSALYQTTIRLSTGSKTTRRVVIADKPVYEHVMSRCEAYAQSPMVQLCTHI